MDLKTYYFGLSNENREIFARKCGTSRGHMQNVAYGYRTASPEIAVAAERESNGVITVDSVLPAKWQRIEDHAWPHPLGRPLLDLAEARAA